MTGSSYVAGPAGGGPGVLVLHAWWGLSDGIRRFCDQLAGEGFVALAPDAHDPASASLALRRTAGFLRSQLQNHPAAPPPEW